MHTLETELGFRITLDEEKHLPLIADLLTEAVNPDVNLVCIDTSDLINFFSCEDCTFTVGTGRTKDRSLGALYNAIDELRLKNVELSEVEGLWMHIRQDESLDYDFMISYIDAVKEILDDRSIFLCTGALSSNRTYGRI